MNRTLARTAIVLAAVVAVPATVSAQHASGAPPATQQAPAMKDIVQVATDAGTFTTLVTALKAAGLVETLQGEGPFTVFAPSDAAFARLPAGTLESLLADREALAAILTFHVVPGRVTAADIVQAGGATPRTVNGQPLDIQLRDGTVFVNGARVVTADVGASNGVIHVIDSVLLPASAPAQR